MGDRSKEDWLARTTGTTTGEAIGIFATGEALTDLPAVAEAVRAGTLSPVQAKEVAGAAVVAPDAQERLLRQAKRGSVGELRDLCKQTRAAADRDPEATHARVHAARRASKRDEMDGSASITLTGTPADVGRMWIAAQHRAKDIFREAYRDGRREPEAAYLFDGFKELLTSAARGPALPVGANAKIVFLLDWNAHVRGRVEGSERCELVGQGPVPVSVVHEAARDAFIASVVSDGKDVRLVHHLGRRPNAHQATALQAMMPTCVVRGCNRTVRLQIHHILDWSKTHLTVLDFLEPRCSHHHDLETNDGWTLGPPDDDRKRELIPPPTERAVAPPPTVPGVDPNAVNTIWETLDLIETERRPKVPA